MNIEDFKHIISNNRPVTVGEKPRYSVLAPLVFRDGKWHLLYELRSENLNRQPGEVSFPGGRIEEGESSLDCAVRETAEEIGIPESHIELIGELEHVTTHDGFSLCCVLARLEDGDFEGSMNPDEVQAVFLVPLDFLMSCSPRKVSGWYEFHYEGYVIWGLTARLTMKLIGLLETAGDNPA